MLARWVIDMKTIIKRIKKDCFDGFMDRTISKFEKTGELLLSEDLIEANSEPIFIGGQTVEIDIDIDKYKNIASEDTFGYSKFAKVGMELHKDFKSSEVEIPTNILYEKELWAYISLTSFKDVVKELRLKDEGKITPNKIKQFYFNTGGVSRTGLLFLWVMVDRLNSEDEFDITNTAFEFIDPVKAILERTMSKNPSILRAFVQGIINNNKDSRFKSDKYRSKVPSNISCYASVNVLDVLDYNELVKVITEQQKAIITE